MERETVSLPHPDVPEWLSEPTWSSDGEFKTWTTEGDGTPFAMRHDRDFMMRGEQVEQDYNFITYFFGDPEKPVQARIYLDDPSAVSVIPVDQASCIPDEVMLFLKKRFRKISVLGDEGYTRVWPE